MTIIDLSILIGYLEQILYFISRNIKQEKDANLVAIMTKLTNAIKPIYDEVCAIKRAGRWKCNGLHHTRFLAKQGQLGLKSG